MVFLKLKPNNPTIHKSIHPSSGRMTLHCFQSSPLQRRDAMTVTSSVLNTFLMDES